MEWKFYVFEGKTLNYLVKCLNKTLRQSYILDEPCKLYCSPNNENYFELFNSIAEDGTSCSTKSNSLCLQGVCRVLNLYLNKLNNCKRITLIKLIYERVSDVIGHSIQSWKMICAVCVAETILLVTF